MEMCEYIIVNTLNYLQYDTTANIDRHFKTKKT